MPTQDRINAAISAGYTPEQINNYVASRQKKPSMVGQAVELGMDVLNAPSYAIGGALRGGREAGLSGAARGLFGGVKEGFATSGGPTVYSELPKTLGLKEGSLAAKAVGLGGELLTPNIPFAGLLGKAGKVAGKVTGLGKVGGVAQDVGRTLLEKSYKLSASDIEKIGEAIGATNPATRSMQVIDYLEGLKLGGANRGSLAKLGTQIGQKQQAFDALTKTGSQVNRQPFIENILNEAIKAEKIDTPQSRQLAKKLFDEAYLQSKKTGAFTDTELSEKISSLFNEAKQSAISDPSSMNLAKRLAIAGQDTREAFSPGSKQIGRDLRGMITAQEVLGKKADTGLGTQLLNAVKPSALGIGLGAGVSAYRGENPLIGGLVGAAGATAINNPRLMNVAGKTLTRGLPQIPRGFSQAAGRALDVSVRAPKFTQPQQPQQPQTSGISPTIPKATPPMPKNTLSTPSTTGLPERKVTTELKYKPVNTFKNKTSFGKSFRLKPGAFS